MEDVKVYRTEWQRNEETGKIETVLVKMNWKTLFAEMVELTINKDYFPCLDEFDWPEDFYGKDGFDYDKAWEVVYSKMSEVFD